MHTHSDTTKNRYTFNFNYLYTLLFDLYGVQQCPRYHPEGDALYHSLQVFEQALECSKRPDLWAAALFHDVGKALNGPSHAHEGARMLETILRPPIVWLVEHHLDLLIKPRRVRKQLAGKQALADLELLRRWDLQGRDPNARVISADQAIDILRPHADTLFI